MGQTRARVTAVLGPTNTGKTHYAIERMLGYRTGVIGLPLRLLAREVYDRIVSLRGPSVVALVTGEERIVPPRTRYWVATVEAMPLEIGADFLAVDEIQLCADPERGHVFTDRLLHARGSAETLFLGSETMRGAINALVPRVSFVSRTRFSRLTYSGARKISRMPTRAAIVGFSVDNVYAIAELLRRQKGGAAVVLGALSPRTRNRQVALYQNGDVEHLVATDAIGMGLNLDIDHVAFSALSKFDGRRMRALAPNELAQIAGRAGRYMNDGSFGVTGDAPALSAEVVAAIEEHRFTPLKRLQWRNRQLQFGSLGRLIASLEAPSGDDWLLRARESDDLIALKTLGEMPEIADRMASASDVRLLWDICQVPDFRNITAGQHAALLAHLLGFLQDRGHIPADWLAARMAEIDRCDGDIDTLSKRLAFIRTWTYVSQRKNWLEDQDRWRGETRAVEDRLSDALHDRLTQRFVDRRTSVLLRRLKQKESLVADVNNKGEVSVDGQFIGRLTGFRFQQDQNATPAEAKTLRAAGLAALKPEFNLRSDRFYNAPDTEIDFTEQGGLMWGDAAVGKLLKGPDIRHPGVEVFVDDEAGPEVAEKVARRLGHFIERKIATLFEPLLAIENDAAITGMARGVGFRLVEALGILRRSEIADDVKALDQEARGLLRRHGVRFGQYTIFQQLMLKPAPTRLRLVLWSLAMGFDEFPEAPPPGLVTVPAVPGAPAGYFTKAGYRLAGTRAIRIDMLERLADMTRTMDSRGGFEATADMLSITGMTLEQFAALMEGLGYNVARGEREKVKRPAPAPESPTPEEVRAKSDTESDAGPDAKTPAETAVSDTPPDTPIADDAAESPLAGPSGEPIAPEHSDLPAGETKDAGADDPTPKPSDAPEIEVFYTFTWAPKRARGGARPGPKGGRKMRGKSRPPRDNGPKKASARPPKKKKAIDPDNPFAALMALKEKG